MVGITGCAGDSVSRGCWEVFGCCWDGDGQAGTQGEGRGHQVHFSKKQTIEKDYKDSVYKQENCHFKRLSGRCVPIKHIKRLLELSFAPAKYRQMVKWIPDFVLGSHCNDKIKFSGVKVDVVSAFKYIIELIFSNHLKWCAQPILSDLFLPRLLTQPTHFSASHFQGFTFSTFQLFKFQNVSISLAEC